MTDDGISRKWTRRTKVLLTLAVVLAAYVAFIGVRMYVMQPRLIASRETTFITEPLRPDGTVDYAAALHEEWSKGVTPENNAAVPLARAFGPGIIAPEIRERYFELIGIEPPSTNRTYLITLDDFLQKQGIEDERRRELHDAYQKAHGGDILKKYPELEAWVDANEEPLKEIVAASGRTRFYSPVLAAPPIAELIMGQLATHQQCREAARLLRLRGELHLDSEDVQAACDDAIALRRLGQLVGNSPALIGNIIGIAVSRHGAALSARIVMSRQFTESHAKTFRNRLEQLPPFADLKRTVDVGERFTALDTFGKWITRGDQHEMRFVFPEFEGPVPKLDPNVVLRETNRTYDRWVAALDESDASRRQLRLDNANDHLQTEVELLPSFVGTLGEILVGDRTGLTRKFSPALFFEMVHAIQQAQKSQDLNTQETQLVLLGVTLGESRAVNGAFPLRLEDLPADRVKDVPTRDLWGRPLMYRQSNEGFLLYSISPNGRDDGGRHLGENEGEEERFDDIRFGIAPRPEAEEVPSGT